MQSGTWNNFDLEQNNNAPWSLLDCCTSSVKKGFLSAYQRTYFRNVLQGTYPTHIQIFGVSFWITHNINIKCLPAILYHTTVIMIRPWPLRLRLGWVSSPN
jgi:hypothetical protein